MGVADGAVGRRSCGGWTGGLDGGWRGFFGWFGFLKVLDWVLGLCFPFLLCFAVVVVVLVLL